MSKISKNIENPIDNIFIYFSKKSSVFYKNIGLTPNILTTLSLIFGILSGYLLYKGYSFLSMIFWFIAYYYDCCDGYFARKYNMESKFGDFYDHFSDFSKLTLILIIMFMIDKEKFLYWIPLIIFTLSLALIHLGCQEKIYNNNENSVSIDKLKVLCPNKNNIKYTKYFGTGTFTLFIGYIILTYNNF